MAESTATTYLVYADVPTGDTLPESFSKLCDIIDYPDLSSPAERIETTTLSNRSRTYIKGLADQAEQNFTANFDRDEYNTIKAFGDDQKIFAILFSESKSLIYFKGQSHVSIAGGGVGDVRSMSITLYPNEEPVMDSGNWEYKEDTKTVVKATA